jgi:hypothetical protein
MMHDQMTPEEMTFAIAWRVIDPPVNNDSDPYYYNWWVFASPDDIPWNELDQAVDYQMSYDNVPEHHTISRMHHRSITPPPDEIAAMMDGRLHLIDVSGRLHRYCVEES